jgi:hypothetical protein
LPRRVSQSFILILFFVLPLMHCGGIHSDDDLDLDFSSLQPRIISLDIPEEYDGTGGIITADVNGDGSRDFVVTRSGYVGVYSQERGRLWSRGIDLQLTSQSEKEGLPGLQSPGVQVAQANGQVELLLLTRSGNLMILEAETGENKAVVSLPVPSEAERWEHLVVANFRGEGDRDLLLQATNAEGYRMGRFLAAYSLDEITATPDPKPLWEKDDFIAAAHNGARVADINQDGRDEVLGGMIVGPDGKDLFRLDLVGHHIDSVFAAKVRPDISGLQVVALEEGGSRSLISGRMGRLLNRFVADGNRVFLFNHNGLIWETHYRHWEPQNAAIGNFAPQRRGLEIWCRSRFNRNQKPFVFDYRGRLLSRYELKDRAPEGWSENGLETIFTIDWTGGEKQLAVGKERHKSGHVAIFNPLTGRFLRVFEEDADHLFVADVSGDWREEIIVLSGRELRIYENPEPNRNPDREPLWTQNHYLRSKMTWNYYSP